MKLNLLAIACASAVASLVTAEDADSSDSATYGVGKFGSCRSSLSRLRASQISKLCHSDVR